MRAKQAIFVVAAFLGFIAYEPAWSAMGRTAGSFNVTPTGTATYTIPIFAPPGPRSMQPSIALVYSSKGGIGPVGKGWSIAGLSAITRCNRTVAQDGIAFPIQLQTTDELCLNGNRLRLTSGTPGMAGSTYQTEIADFSLVTAVGTKGNGPASFTVKGKDGLTYDYGTDTTSQVLATGTSTVSVWMLRQISDRSNNRVQFTYVAAGSGLTGTTNPSTIEWTATTSGGSTFRYSMAFTYGSNTPPSSQAGYVAGTAVTDDDLLSDISISNSGTVVRKYFLAYNTSPTTGVYRLHTVTECSDSAGSDCLLPLTPTTIGYQDGQVGVSGSAISTTFNGSRVADFNGDGFEDLIYTNGGVLTVAWGSSSGYSTSTSVGVGGTIGSGVLIGDVQGTGQDVILVASGGSWNSYIWNGSSFAMAYTGTAVSGANQYLLDIDGDGRADLISAQSSSGNLGQVDYRLSISTSSAVIFSSTATVILSGISPPPGSIGATSSVYLPNSAGRYQHFDINGDGKEDLTVSSAAGVCNPSMPYPPYCTFVAQVVAYIQQPNGSFVPYTVWGYSGATSTGNFPIFLRANDDACTDSAVYDPNYSTTTVYLSACDGSTATSVTVAGYLTTAMDWDGDGRLDLLFGTVGNPIYVSLSTGVGFASPISTGLAYCNMFVLDANGDGLDDLGCWGSGTSYYLHNGAGVKPDLATSFTDGYGVNQTVTYQPATWNYYTKQSGSTSPNKDYAGPLQLAGNVNRSDGIGGTYNQSYWYYGGAVNIQGRGFAGFASRKVTDSRTDGLGHYLYSMDYFDRTFPTTGGLTKSEVYQSSGTLVSQRNISLTENLLDATTNSQRHFVYSPGGSSYTYEVGGAANGNLITQTSESRTYDSWGNVTASTVVTTDQDATSPLHGATWTQSTSSTFSPDTSSANWCLGLPTASSVTFSTSVPGELSVIRSQGFTPNNVYCRMDAESIGSGNRQVDTAYRYDMYGNVDRVQVTGRNSAGLPMPMRTSSAIWGSANGTSGGTGQFPVSETNALGQTSTRTFHSTFGGLATETDPNGIVVVNDTYDLYGRVSKVSRPYGPTALYSYVDCASYGCQSGNPAGGSTAIDKLLVIESLRDVSNTVIRTNWKHFDLFDRPIVEKYQAGNGGYDRISRQYDALGRVSRQIAPCDDASCTAFWVTNSYDLLGRIVSQSRPQNQIGGAPLQTTSFAYGGRTQTITDPQSKVTTKILDVNGWMRRSQDHNGYYQNFGYDSAGSLTQVTDSLSNTLFKASYSYGIQAFQDSANDMDLDLDMTTTGGRKYYYDSLGELTSWTDAKSQSFSQIYDALSRVTSRTEAEGTTTFTFGTSAGSYNIGQLASVSMTGYSESLSYDNKGRLSTRNITTDQPYSIDYAYNTQGLPDTLTYPTSTSSTRVKVKYGYAYGYMNSVTDWTSGSAGTVYWTANIRNHRNQTTRETLGNGVVTNRAIDAVTGWPSSIQSGVGSGAGLQNQSYAYDLVGNVTQRQENNLGLTENFYYDNLYRLDYSTRNGTTNLDLSYDAMGNILTKTDVAGTGGWSYHSTKKHAVASTGTGGYSYSYDNNGNMTSRNGSTISWTSYNYPTLLASGSESTGFYYGPDRQYYKQIYTGPSGTETTIYVGGLLEKVTLPGGTTDWRHYIQAEGQTVAIVSRLSSGSNTVSYPLEDHEGSSAVLTSSSGASIVKESFNAFGLPRNGSTWSGAVPSGDKTLINGLTRRGYTFHSMLGDMGLIHMNGRVQDAVTGRFLSPDPTIPDPGFTQSFNRYSYVNNNPLSFIDPSGFDDVGNIDVGAKCRGQTDPVWTNRFKTEWQCLPNFLDRNTLCSLAAAFHVVDVGDSCSNSTGGQQNSGTGDNGGNNTASSPDKPKKPAPSPPVPKPPSEPPPQPHHYELDVSLGICVNLREGFDVMRNFATPGGEYARDGTHEMELAGGNWIQQTVDPEAMTIKNVAIPGRHVFGGSVEISMFERNGVTGVHIKGEGNGPNATENQFWGPKIFEGLGLAAFTGIQCNGVGAL